MKKQVILLASLFLAILGCSNSHNRPFNSWKIKDIYTLATAPDESDILDCIGSKIEYLDQRLVIRAKGDCYLKDGAPFQIISVFPMSKTTAMENYSHRIVSHIFRDSGDEFVWVFPTDFLVENDGSAVDDWQHIFGKGQMSLLLLPSGRKLLSIGEDFLDVVADAGAQLQYPKN